MYAYTLINWEISLLGLAWAAMAIANLANQRAKTAPHYIVMVWLCLLCLPLIHTGLVFHAFEIEPFFTWTNPTLNLLHGPLLLIYVRALTQTTNQALIRRHLIHLLPAIVFYALYLAMSHPELMRPSPVPETGLGIEHSSNPFNHWLAPLMRHFGLVNAISFIGYAIATLCLLHRHQARIGDYFAHKPLSFRLTWIFALPATFALLSVFNLLYNLAEPSTNAPPVISIQLTTGVLFIALLSYFGPRQQTIFSASPNTARAGQKIAKQTAPPANAKRVQQAQQILDYLEQSQAFTESELSIYQLAERVSLPYHEVSSAINQGLGKNFYQLINELRLAKIKGLLEQNRHDTIMTMALECGFNSKSNFNRLFKQHYGVTPSQMQRQASHRAV